MICQTVSKIKTKGSFEKNDPFLFAPSDKTAAQVGLEFRQGLASAAHKPTFFDFMLEQLVVPLVTVTV